ncbi:protein-glutamate methylesterase/protein-glutamine glutaminase [Clostridium thermarum]|uniref:protein-glutamate methylesterase/protein-glutamine glutaminase n=1 Tax=Clostridium thermarum TaxID=1716543 RepID=UPI0011223AE2|nr:chemotaxis response regulator protein-glutamate methylesterase [Clostridium thermarum]
MNLIKVLVVDDSALMRKIISDMINSQADMKVVDTARNGEDLLSKVQKVQPDVITLDVEMPIMGGIQALQELKRRNIDIPVIVLSSVSSRDTSSTMECLEAGAFDFISKPSGQISLDIDKVKGNLIERIKLAFDKGKRLSFEGNKYAGSPNGLEKNKRRIDKKTVRIRPEAVVIGASTGGPKALYTVITALPANIGVPIFVVQHMPAGFTKAFADRLNANSDLTVVEAGNGQYIEKNTVYVAPGGFHMELTRDKRIELNKEPAIWGVRPAVDKLFMTAAEVYGSNLVSIVLTGMGRDGAAGTVEIKKKGGITISEDESTCTIYGMPKAAYETGMVDEVLPLGEIPAEIVTLVMG